MGDEDMVQHHFTLSGGDVSLFTSPPLPLSSEDLFTELLNNTPWDQKSVFIYGQERPQPRLVAWYGDYGYTYSGLRLEPVPMTDLLQSLSQTMSHLTGTSFNGVLLNLYRDGKDSIGMHSDDEIEFGENPVIASLSLGAERWFDLERKDKSDSKKILLTDGSVFVMRGLTQHFWKHGISKTKDPVGPRINLTFRNIINPQ